MKRLKNKLNRRMYFVEPISRFRNDLFCVCFVGFSNIFVYLPSQGIAQIFEESYLKILANVKFKHKDL